MLTLRCLHKMAPYDDIARDITLCRARTGYRARPCRAGPVWRSTDPPVVGRLGGPADGHRPAGDRPPAQRRPSGAGACRLRRGSLAGNGGRAGRPAHTIQFRDDGLRCRPLGGVCQRVTRCPWWQSRSGHAGRVVGRRPLRLRRGDCRASRAGERTNIGCLRCGGATVGAIPSDCGGASDISRVCGRYHATSCAAYSRRGASRRSAPRGGGAASLAYGARRHAAGATSRHGPYLLR